MLTIFESILLGHLIGDFILQNTWMAQRKGASMLPCVVHCLIYTACLCLVVPHGFNLWWAGAVFVSHFPIDRWSLADRWLHVIEGRTLKGFLEHGHENVPDTFKGDLAENYTILRGGFSALVYCVVDNTFHLCIMVLGYKVLNHLGLM